MKLSDIAKLAHVSVTTASYVINGHAAQRRISLATVERVQAVVEQYGYRPDQQAAGLRRGHSHCLGFILPDLENPSYARLAKLLEHKARTAGYQLLIASSDDNPDSERQLIELFRSRRCAALIVASCLPQDDPLYPALVAGGLPIIAVDRALCSQYIRSVVSDDEQAVKQLAQSLLTPKPRHIALLGARPELVISQARERGFHQALVGFDGRISVYHGEQFNRASGYQQMQHLLADVGPPDALITTAYVLLEGVLDVLHQQPDATCSALRLATFGDTQLLDFLPTRVNTTSQQHERIAERAMAWALQAIEQADYQPGIEAIERCFKARL